MSTTEKLQALREKVARSIESDLPSIPAEEVFERLERHYRQRAGKS